MASGTSLIQYMHFSFVLVILHLNYHSILHTPNSVINNLRTSGHNSLSLEFSLPSTSSACGPSTKLRNRVHIAKNILHGQFGTDIFASSVNRQSTTQQTSVTYSSISTSSGDSSAPSSSAYNAINN